jgi:cyclase
VLLNSIDRDGTQSGYDLELIRRVSSAVTVPVVACGGAGSIQDLREAVMSGASAAAAGSLFVFRGPHRAVLINYPSAEELSAAFGNLLSTN